MPKFVDVGTVKIGVPNKLGNLVIIQTAAVICFDLKLNYYSKRKFEVACSQGRGSSYNYTYPCYTVTLQLILSVIL